MLRIPVSDRPMPDTAVRHQDLHCMSGPGPATTPRTPSEHSNMNSDLAYTYTRLCDDIRLILRDFGTETGWIIIESAIKSQLNTTNHTDSSLTPPDKDKQDENTRILA